MCFSASASFTAAAFLMPMGLYGAFSSIGLKRNHYLMLALVPFFFGLQQLIEGGVWLAIAANNDHWMRMLSVGFVFFSHFFWPFWIPISAYLLAENKRTTRAWIKLFLAAVGTVSGVLFFIPILMNPHAVQAKMCANSLQYSFSTIEHALYNTSIYRWLYVVLIVLPLLISRDNAVKILGVLIAISVALTYAFYSYAFNSVWCFFCAVLSIYILYLVRRIEDHHSHVKSPKMKLED